MYVFRRRGVDDEEVQYLINFDIEAPILFDETDNNKNLNSKIPSRYSTINQRILRNIKGT